MHRSCLFCVSALPLRNTPLHFQQRRPTERAIQVVASFVCNIKHASLLHQQLDPPIAQGHTTMHTRPPQGMYVGRVEVTLEPRLSRTRRAKDLMSRVESECRHVAFLYYSESITHLRTSQSSLDHRNRIDMSSSSSTSILPQYESPYSELLRPSPPPTSVREESSHITGDAALRSLRPHSSIADGLERASDEESISIPESVVQRQPLRCASIDHDVDRATRTLQMPPQVSALPETRLRHLLRLFLACLTRVFPKRRPACEYDQRSLKYDNGKLSQTATLNLLLLTLAADSALQQPEGWPSLAAFQNSQDEFVLFRRFGTSFCRVLLILQADIAALENSLQKLDHEDDQGMEFKYRLSSARHEEGWDATQRKLIEELTQKLTVYGNYISYFSSVKG